MRNVVFVLVFIAPPWLKKVILRWYCGASFGRGAHIGWLSSVVGDRVSMGEFSAVKPLTLIRCDGAVEIGSYTEVSSFSLVYGCASLRIGDRCYVGPQSLVNVSRDVTLGNEVGLGARTMIFTHGAFFRYTDGYWANFGEVRLGNNVWLAAGVFVHPGTTVEDDVFVNARSVIRGIVASGSVMEGAPAREVTRLERLRRTVSDDRRDVLIVQILADFLSFLRSARRDFLVTEDHGQWCVVRRGNVSYLVTLLPNNGTFPIAPESRHTTRLIVLSNVAERSWMAAYPNAMVFDFRANSTSCSDDRLHGELYDFMKMYYGLIFSREIGVDDR